jgi:hypothetical protein
MFASGGNVLNNLTLNMAGSRSVVSLGSDLTLNNSLNLMSGMLTIDTNDLAINPGGMINGGSSSSYVVANSSGSLIMNLVAGDIDTFKIGTSVNFAPIVVSAASGSSTGNVSVNIIGQVYEDGTSGTVISATNSMVSATWFVSSDASGAINYSLTAVWDTSMEVNGFDRTQAYISHYTGGGWDIQPLTASASVGAGMYSMTRTGITSLSPFRVADKYSSTFTPDVSLNTDVIVYPNPATSTLNFTQGDKINSVEIYNLLGEVNTFSHLDNNSVSVLYLASGVYFAHFTGDGINTIITFIKQ